MHAHQDPVKPLTSFKGYVVMIKNYILMENHQQVQKIQSKMQKMHSNSFEAQIKAFMGPFLSLGCLKQCDMSVRTLHTTSNHFMHKFAIFYQL